MTTRPADASSARGYRARLLSWAKQMEILCRSQSCSLKKSQIHQRAGLSGRAGTGASHVAVRDAFRPRESVQEEVGLCARGEKG